MALSPAARRGILVFTAGIAIVAVALTAQYLGLTTPGGSLDQAVGGVEAPGRADIGGDFTLVDQNGVTRRAGDFRGKLMLVYFGYTYCPDVCPTELQTMSDALDRLGAKGEAVQPIFITVDPQRDTVEAMKDYAANFHPRLLALTGSADAIAAAARAYRVYYRPVKQEGTYLVDHSSVVYLMGRDGRYLAHFDGATNAAQMAAAIAKNL